MVHPVMGDRALTELLGQPVMPTTRGRAIYSAWTVLSCPRLTPSDVSAIIPANRHHEADPALPR